MRTRPKIAAIGRGGEGLEIGEGGRRHGAAAIFMITPETGGTLNTRARTRGVLKE